MNHNIHRCGDVKSTRPPMERQQSWRAIHSLTRVSVPATLLPSGEVLVAGSNPTVGFDDVGSVTRVNGG